MEVVDKWRTYNRVDRNDDDDDNWCFECDVDGHITGKAEFLKFTYHTPPWSKSTYGSVLL